MFTKSLDADHPLNNLLNRALAQKTVSSPNESIEPIMWKAERYNLNKSKLFNSMDLKHQNDVQQYITELNLSLSYYIEKSGHNYGAKMILLADTIEEKSLYSLFVAEEAVHLQEFKNFINFKIDPSLHWHPMLNCLAEVIKDGEKNTLTFVIQVLLEGFGMAHYASLRDDCSNENLKKTYDQILIDEARHHGAGIILSGSNDFTKLEKEQVFEYTRMFIKSLQEADWLFKSINRFTKKDISPKEKKDFYLQIDYFNKLELRLQKLKQMILKVDKFDLCKMLEKDNVFKPLMPA